MTAHRIEEPCEVWRIRFQDGRVAHAVVLPNAFCWSLAWFINNVLEGGEDCPDWESAVTRAGLVRQGLAQRAATTEPPQLSTEALTWLQGARFDLTEWARKH